MIADQDREIIAGVDTHGQTHHAAVVDAVGRHLADREFPATGAGYRQLVAWLGAHGTVHAVGVEGTGSYGAELARMLTRTGLQVVEVDRPDRKTRRMKGKSDPIDAYAAAAAVLSGRASGTPKSRDGIVEAIRALHVPRRSAVKARTQAINQARQLIVTAPQVLREKLQDLSGRELAQACSRLRPGDLTSVLGATKAALRRLGRRITELAREIAELDAELKTLTSQAAPSLMGRKGVGAQVTAQLLITAGDNPGRLRSEAAFAHLCGVAPVPASSGRRDRHRLNRGGDRAANHALHMIAVTRMRCDERTRTYVTRRTAQGLSKMDIMRCLKRHIAREAYRALTNDLRVQASPTQPPTTHPAQAA